MNVPIKDLAERVGTVIPGVKGKVTKVFPPKEGDGAHGRWKLQNVSIEDDSGSSQVTLSGVETMDEGSLGDTVEFQSVGTKFGLKGVSVEQREWTDKTGAQKKTIGVKITKTAQIRWNGEEGVQNSPSEPQEAPKAHTTTYKTHPISKSPEARIKQFALLYALCFNEAARIKIGAAPTEVVKDIASCLFIQSVREGLADKMDTKEVESEEIPF